MPRPTALRCLLIGATLGVVAFCPVSAHAASFFRARFEPETLELKDAGTLELDFQLGAVYGDGVDGSRLITPDFELALGLTDWLEADIDGQFSVTNLGTREIGMGGNPLWTSLRVELLDLEEEETGNHFGLGLQVGPRFRTVDNARGVGLGAVGLVGGGSRTLHAVVNFGTFVDQQQAAALVFGAGIEWDIERRHKWSVQGQLAGAHYFGDVGPDADPDQIFLIAGVGREVDDDLELSLLALAGPFARGDRVGLLAGITWDNRLW